MLGQLGYLGLLPSQTATFTSNVVPSDTTTYPEGIVFDKVGSTFTGENSTVVQNSYDLVALTGTCSGTVTTYTASAYTQYEGMVVAMLRSRANYASDDLVWETQQISTGLVMNPGSVATNPLADFELSATSNTTSGVTKYDVSLDTSKRNYISRVLGNDCFDGDTMVFLEEHYPKFNTHRYF